MMTPGSISDARKHAVALIAYMLQCVTLPAGSQSQEQTGCVCSKLVCTGRWYRFKRVLRLPHTLEGCIFGTTNICGSWLAAHSVHVVVCLAVSLVLCAQGAGHLASYLSHPHVQGQPCSRQ